jgi:hypothetical protein
MLDIFLATLGALAVLASVLSKLFAAADGAGGADRSGIGERRTGSRPAPRITARYTARSTARSTARFTPRCTAASARSSCPARVRR